MSGFTGWAVSYTHLDVYKRQYQIGVFQYTQHAALDEANEGFVAALEESGLDCEIDQQNASGDSSATLTIGQKMVDDKKDLIFTIATPAAQAVAGLTSEIPVVLTAVTDPADADLVESNEAPGGNVTGTSDMNPVEKQVELLQQLIPDAKKVAVLYCSAEANSKLQAELVAETCKKAGIETVDYTVANSGEDVYKRQEAESYVSMLEKKVASGGASEPAEGGEGGNGEGTGADAGEGAAAGNGAPQEEGAAAGNGAPAEGQ